MTSVGAQRDGEDQARFDALCDGFARARAAAGCDERHLRFAGQPVVLRVAGDALAECVQTPFEHLRAPNREAPQLTIELWDCRETGVARPPAAQPQGRVWDLGDSVLAASAAARFVSHALRGGVVWFDRHARRITGCFADADLSLHQRSKPLQMLLTVWASDRDLQPVHASLVAREGRGVLFPGPGRSGKSTAALACLQDGYHYAGDDWIALGHAADGSPVGHGIYGTATLEPAHARCFAALQPRALPARGGAEEKSLLLLSRVAAERLTGSVAIHALVLPRVTDRVDTCIRPASSQEAALTIVPSSVFAMSPRGGRRDVERLFDFAARIPAYRLEIGRDLRQIPHRVDDILQELARS